MENEDYYNSDEYKELVENSPHESCPKCGSDYDDADFDFQICSVCRWDIGNDEYY